MHRHPARRATLALLLVGIALTVAVPSATARSEGAAPATSAGADTGSSTTRTTLVPGEAAVTPEGSPRNTTGLVVGLVTVGIIVVGALVLFLRYRGRGNRAG